jgi:hypothetical protein
MEPELSIVAFKRKGWAAADYQKWREKLLADQIGFIPQNPKTPIVTSERKTFILNT